MHESLENYLETILLLSERLTNVRSIDIAKEMGYSKPSVSIAVKKMREEGYIAVDERGFITFTEQGLERAKNVLERHHVITEFLGKIGVPEDIAEEDACRVEHVISDTTFQKLKELVAKL